MTDAEISARVLELNARQQIHDCLMRNARGVDRLDRDLMISSYHPDATDHHGAYAGNREGFADWVISRHTSTIECSTHFIGNSLVEVLDDTASGETYVTTFSRYRENGSLMSKITCGRYIDRFACRNGDWRIANREVVIDWEMVNEAGDNAEGPLSAVIPQGKRSREDLSYSVMATLTR